MKQDIPISFKLLCCFQIQISTGIVDYDGIQYLLVSFYFETGQPQFLEEIYFVFKSCWLLQWYPFIQFFPFHAYFSFHKQGFPVYLQSLFPICLSVESSPFIYSFVFNVIPGQPYYYVCLYIIDIPYYVYSLIFCLSITVYPYYAY